MKKIISLVSLSLVLATFATINSQSNINASSISFNTNRNLIQNSSTIVNTSTFAFPTIHQVGQTIIPNKTPLPTVSASQTPKPSATNTPTPTPISQSSQNSYIDQVIQLVNAERSKAGLTPLTKNDNLVNSAQNYAEYMASANFFGHTAPDGSTFVDRIKKSGYTNYRWIGENIAAGQKTPQEVIAGWMASSGHRANILNVNAKEIGVGYTANNSSKYKTYWVQHFGSKQ